MIPRRKIIEDAGTLRGLEAMGKFINAARPVSEDTVLRLIKNEGFPAKFIRGIGWLTTKQRAQEWIESWWDH